MHMMTTIGGAQINQPQKVQTRPADQLQSD